MSHILLVGFMGAGKSTVAQLVADELNWPCVDLDRLVESVDGRTIAEIFAQDGELTFRQLESAALAGLIGEAPSVVACGGGVVTRDENRAVLKSLGLVVYLRVTAEEMLARVGADASRPLLGQAIEATALLDARESLYSAVADISVDTVGRSVESVAQEIVEFIRKRDVS